MSTTTPAGPEAIEPHPNVPLKSRDLPFLEFSGGVRFGDRTIPLGEHGGSVQVGFNLVELPPGKQSCPFHFHMHEEEHFYILQGRCILRSGEQRHEMGPGDYACFPAGTGVAHATLNPFDEPCLMIVAGTRSPTEVCVYPDSQKMMLREMKSIVRWPQEKLGYDDGERSDEPLT